MWGRKKQNQRAGSAADDALSLTLTLSRDPPKNAAHTLSFHYPVAHTVRHAS